jgi:transposase
VPAAGVRRVGVRGADTVDKTWRHLDFSQHQAFLHARVPRVRCAEHDANLTAGQRRQLTWLTRPSMRLQTARAARWRDDVNAFYDQPTPADAEAYLRRWCVGAKRSRLEPVKTFVRLVESHWDGIIAWQHSQLSNGLLEDTNSLIQAAKRRARGYRSKTKMITVIYLIAGKLRYPKSTRSSEEPPLANPL